MPPGWFADRSAGSGRRYLADVDIRRTPAGRIILLRGGRVIWRSRRLYYRDGGDVAFGPSLFAFAAYRRGIYITDLRGPERLIMRGRSLYPYDFTRRGELLVTRGWHQFVILGRDGNVLRRFRYRANNGVTFDPHTETLYFVRPDRVLATADGARLRAIAARRIDGWVTYSPPRLLIWSGKRSVTITRLDGTMVAHARWPQSSTMELDSGPSVSANGRLFSFRLSNRRPGAAKGRAALYTLRRGHSRAHLVLRQRLDRTGCAVGAYMSWHGRFLLYQTYGTRQATRLIIDSADGRIINLERLIQALPGRRVLEREVSWQSGYPAARPARR